MEYRVEIKQVEPQTIAVVRRRASLQELSRVIPEACGVVWNVIKANQVQGAGRHVAVYLDCQMNLEVGAEVGPSFPGYGEVVASQTPGGTVIAVAHFGPYNKLGEAHNAIHKYCSEHGLTLAGPSWEIYGHWNDDPAQLRTDVFYLLQTEDKAAAR